MQKFPTIKYCSIAFCILLVCAELTSSAPAYNDYESIRDVRDLVEFILQKEAMEDQLSQPHQIVRKSSRSPSLRLRFGKKSDPYLSSPHYIGQPVHLLDDPTDN